MAAIAGKGGAIYPPKGEPIQMTGEACSQVSGNIYRITDTTKRYIDTRQTYTVKDNAVAVASRDYQFSPGDGRIYFDSAPTTPVTIDGYYLALDTAIAGFHNWSLDITRDMLETTEFGDSWKAFIAGQNHFTGSAERWWQTTAINGESIGTGDGSTVTFTGFVDYSPIVSASLSITDTVETFTDTDGDGNLTGSAGGTGTINYTTGAFSVTFNVAPVNAQNITTDYTYDLFFNRIGTKFIFAFYVDTANSLRYIGEAFITSNAVNVPIGELVNESLEFEGDGYIEYSTW